jgi:hypothetical protein
VGALWLLSVSSRPARADDEPRWRLFLPLVELPPPREPCGQPVGDRCAAGPERDWTVVCGGFGRVRDLVIPTPGAPDGRLGVVAVGDGAADLDLHGPMGWGTPPAVQWRPQLGAGLTGLNALSVDLDADVAGIEAWAVGARDHILRRVAGCWRPEAGAAPPDDPAVTLAGVHANAPVGGWAVGRAERAGRRYGVLRTLVAADDGGEPAWVDYGVTPLPPPLSDVSFNHLGGTATPDAWAVGQQDGTGVFLHGVPGPSGRWRWTERARRVGEPRELTLRTDEGWSFGSGSRDGVRGLMAWRYVAGAVLWEPDPEFFVAGRELVDMYTESSEGDERLWVGISPAPGQPVLAYLDLESRRWIFQGPAPQGLPAADEGGDRAIAPDSPSRVVYAWGDEVWLYQPPPTPPAPEASPEPDHLSWSLLRRSRNLTGFLPPPSGGWALADEGPGRPSALLAYRGGALHEEALVPRRLTALDAVGGQGWAVGEAGTALRLQDGLWRTSSSEPAVLGDFLDVAVGPDGTTWAVGLGADGRGRAWRRAAADEGWVELMATTGTQALRSVAVVGDGAWAVGDGCLAVRLPREGLATTTSVPCSGQSDPVGLVAVTGLSETAVWAAGAYYVYRWDGRRWRLMQRPEGGSALWFMGQGESVVALASSPSGEVWGAYLAASPTGREASTLIRLAGSDWRRDATFSVPVRELRVSLGAGGAETLWLVGDGSTLAARPLGE